MSKDCIRRVGSGFTLLFSAIASTTCGSGNLVLPSEAVPATLVILEGDGQAATVGLPLPDTLVVSIVDARGRPVQNQMVEFLPVLNGTGSHLIPDTAVTDADGLAKARWVLGVVAGRQTAEARLIAPGAAGDLQVEFAATANPGVPDALAIIGGQGQSAIAGSALADSLTVKVTDAFGNPMAGFPVTWSAGSGSLSPGASATGSDGRSSVAWTLGAVAGTQQTTVTGAGLRGSPAVFTAVANVGPPGRLGIVTQPPSSAQSGIAFVRQPAVRLEDLSGNPVPEAGLAVTAAIASGPAGGVLSGNNIAATDGNGIATFLNLGLTGPGGVYVLAFSGVGLSSATSAGVTLVAGQATTTTTITQHTPNPSVVGQGITVGFSVVPASSGGNSPTGTVTVQDGVGDSCLATVAVGSCLLTPTSTGTLSLVASYSGDANFAPSASAGVTQVVGSGAASQLVFVVQPTDVRNGHTIAPPVQIALEDAAGNIIATASSAITVALGRNPSFGILTGTLTVNTVNGVAVFSDLTIDAASRASGYTLTANAPGFPQATSASFKIR